MIDWKGQLLSPAQIWEMSRTEEGRKAIGEYILRARTAYAAQCVMERLGVTPDAETQRGVCEDIYNSISPKRVPIDYIMEYCRQCAEHLEMSTQECVGSA